MSRPTSSRVAPTRAAPVLAALALSVLGACAGPTSMAPSTATSFRHAGLVDRVVIRSLTTGGAALPEAVMRRARREAIDSIAESVDALSVAEVEGLRLDIAIAELSQTSSAVRARCLITVSTVGPPERTRSILQGAVTVHGSAEGTVGEAVARSVRSALRRLPQALATL